MDIDVTGIAKIKRSEVPKLARFLVSVLIRGYGEIRFNNNEAYAAGAAEMKAKAIGVAKCNIPEWVDTDIGEGERSAAREITEEIEKL